MKVLILYTGNSCHNQMAHGFPQLFDKNIEVYSGGMVPAKQVNVRVVGVMKEARINIASHVPTHVNTYLDKEWDYVITVCGGVSEGCLMFTGKVRNRLHIGSDDPSEAAGSPEFANSEFHRVWDEIKARFYGFYPSGLKPQLK